MVSIESKRLISLIEFAQQAARLRTKPITDVTRYQIFHKFEHHFSGLPGIHISTGNEDNKIEEWLVINRLQELPPPVPSSDLLAAWLDIQNNPLKEPSLRSQIQGKDLAESARIANHLSADSNQTISLHTFALRDEIQKLLQTYLDNEWKPWSAAEQLRRRTIAIYSELFSLRQQLVDGVGNAALELIFGMGIAVWNISETKVCYPLITKVVELFLNPINMDIEIRPCDMPPQVEIDLYSALDNLGVFDLDKKIQEFTEFLSQNFSPFDQSTFESILKSVAAHLDPTGVYLNSLNANEDSSLPQASEKLQVTNKWVLFARPRNLNALIQDLECFKNKLTESGGDFCLPPAVASLVADPSKTLETDISLPTFRGLSNMLEGHNASQEAQKLYFPKPYNDDQVRIVQLLEASDGVVVQGPPGTGKTHTIANIICHYLASGKRVLVSSMKEPALAVLKSQLPKELQPLVISLLSQEQDGMKQLEHTVSKIAAEIQRIDKRALAKDVQKFERDIDVIHTTLAKMDRQIKEWAIQNLSPICLDDEIILPIDAAREVIDGLEGSEWFQDSITVDNKFRPQFSDGDILLLREARRILSVDLSYVGCHLPLISSLPNEQTIMRLHDDLVRLNKLNAGLKEAPSKALINTTQETIERVQLLGSKIKTQLLSIRTIKPVHAEWITLIMRRCEQHMKDEILSLFETIGEECETAYDDRKKYLARPIIILEGIEVQAKFIQAIEKLSRGKRPFGLKGLFIEGEAKKILSNIRIGVDSPNSAVDWLYVREYILHLKKFRELLIRWNAAAQELGIPRYPTDPHHLSEAVKEFEAYKEAKSILQCSHDIAEIVKRILPGYEEAHKLWMEEFALNKLDKLLNDHLEIERLNHANAHRKQVLDLLMDNSGFVVNNMREFLNNILGNPAHTDESVKKQWTVLCEEVHRVQKLAPTLAKVLEVCALIEASGAPKWAEQLCTIPAATVDDLLPIQWPKVWRLKRLATYLHSIDVSGELKRLKKIREELEFDLHRIYGMAVEKRVWLKIIENATPSIRSALMAYVAAILKIGKDKGKRAPRYRFEARNAAALAFPAIPCWIMPHHRISQSLPAEFGCFDLVIIDEASQSDLSALPCMLRAKKILIVGDDKQVSPEGIGIEEEEVQRLISRFLSNQVDLFRPHMTPECSIYDLFKVVFAKSAVMLKEHFRSVAPIIEYSKREFYNHELRPLRIAKSLERLDPPLIDILVEDGVRKGNINAAEIRCIVREIKAIVQDSEMSNRSIGVVSLLADQQAHEIWKSLEHEIGLDAMQRHQIACGDAWTFQGKERDIMFLSMVVCPKTATAITRRTFAQRFNVAASRARDRMYLVRSVSLEDLSEADHLRRSLIEHFSSPFAQDETRKVKRNSRDHCQSPFEREVYDLLTEQGYNVIPQVSVGEFCIDIVVEGFDGKRLAIECDGDRYHGPEQWESDMRRQRILERAGWRFWRCFASTFILQREQVVEDLLNTLENLGVRAVGADRGNGTTDLHTETRRFSNLVK